MNKNLQTIKEAVWKAIPEIKELKFGCIVREKPAFGSAFRNNTWKGGKEFPLLMKDTADNWLFMQDVGFDRVKESEIFNWHEILGRDIRLADVLYTVMGSPEIPERAGFWAEIIASWNLLDDNLDHQSEECWELLASLLAK